MEGQAYLIVIIALGCLAMVSLALFVVLFLNIHRKKMLEKEAKIKTMEREKEFDIFKSASEAEEKQKEEIARNLHDQLIPALSAICFSIEKNAIDFINDKFDKARLDRDVAILYEAINDIRGISHNLVPGSLVDLGLMNALQRHLEQINGTNDVMVDYENSTLFDQQTLPFSKQDQLNIFRICLEILNNLHKHAKYKYLKVLAETEKNTFILDFMHDGKGITNQEFQVLCESKNGLGLKSIRSRVLLLRADINYSVEPDFASTKLTIPFNP